MNKTSYTNLAKVWQFVEDRAFSRQSPDLNEVRTAVEREGIPQGSAAQAELLSLLVHVLDASSIIAIGTASVVETLQLIDGLEGRGQLTAVDSSTEGIALIRKLFAGLSDRTQTTLRAVSAPVGTYLPRLNAGDYDLIVVAGDASNYAPPSSTPHGCWVSMASSCSPTSWPWRIPTPMAACPIPPTAATRPWPCANCSTPCSRMNASAPRSPRPAPDC